MKDQAIFPILKNAKECLQTATAKLDAEVLLAHVLKKDRTYLHTWPDKVLTTEQTKQFNDLIKRRMQGEPIAYITGETEFWSLSLKVTPDVLIPRPETELLVELALKMFPTDKNIRVADLGTGSAAIAIAIAKERPTWKIVAVEKSSAALNVAKENSQRHHVTNITFVHNDWLAGLDDQSFNIIISNPPYIAESDPHLTQGDVQYEPQTALTSGTKGLDDLHVIIKQAPKYLSDEGYLLLEHGYQQGELVAELMKQEGFSRIQTQQDLAGLPRVTLGCLVCDT